MTADQSTGIGTAHRASPDAKLYQMLMSTVKDYAIILLDTDGRIMSWNDGARLIKGYSANEIVGENFSKFYTPEDLAISRPEHILKAAHRDGKYEEEGWRVRKDGSRFFAKVVIRPLLSERNELLGFAKVTTDITKAKEDERIIRENEERFRLFMAAVKDYSIIMLDRAGHVINWNEGAHRLKGYEHAEIIGKHFSVFYTPEDILANKPQTELQQAREAGRFEEEGWRVKKDGTRFLANVIVCPLLDSDGSLRGFVKITRDVTEQRESEQNLRDFYSIVSHELRSPMTSIRGALGLLEGGFAGTLTADGAEITADARLCCDRLIRLINDLLDLSKLDSDNFQLSKRDVTASALVTESVKSLRTLSSAKDLRVEISAAPAISMIVDPDRIVQVLTNLISNAIKFAPSKSAIQITVKEEQSEVIFSVRDRGPGIPVSAKEKLFKRFQQLDSSANGTSPGTGLGLAISKSIVEQHGGAIGYFSEPGDGTTFWFSVPKTEISA